MARAITNPGASIQRDAITAWSRSATVFVNYLASTASDRAVLSGKKTVQHHDVLEALDEMDFADFVAKTEAELAGAFIPFTSILILLFAVYLAFGKYFESHSCIIISFPHPQPSFNTRYYQYLSHVFPLCNFT